MYVYIFDALHVCVCELCARQTRIQLFVAFNNKIRTHTHTRTKVQHNFNVYMLFYVYILVCVC